MCVIYSSDGTPSPASTARLGLPQLAASAMDFAQPSPFPIAPRGTDHLRRGWNGRV